MNIPKYIIVHHTGGSDANPLQDSSNFTFEQCNELHRVRFDMKSSLGYYVGYHYYISKNGTVYQARNDNEEGAHAIGYNKSSIGVCLAGNFDVTTPTREQTDSLRSFLRQKSKEYQISTQNIVPHRKFADKSCYGKKLLDGWAANLISEFKLPDNNNEKRQLLVKLLQEVSRLLKLLLRK